MLHPSRTETVETASAPLKPRRLPWVEVWKTFLPYARSHRAPLLKAAAAALFVVGSRIAFPYPLRALLGPWLRGEQAGGGVVLPEQTLLLALAFFGIVLTLGLAEYVQRLQVARFSIGWVRDIRASAFHAANQVDPRSMSLSSGDMVARLVGDTARLKAGLKGFLTHVATNGLLFFGVTTILLIEDLQLGAVVAVAGLLVLGVTFLGAKRVYHRYRELRKKEGKLANRIQESLAEDPREGDFARVNYSSGSHEATVVQIQGKTTLTAHLILGVSTLVTIWIGVRGLQSGRLDAEKLFTFFMFALILHRPAVRLARQGTRIGKMMACGERLERLIRAGRRAEQEQTPLEPLRKHLKIKRLELSAPHRDGDRRRLGPLDLKVPAGQKLLLTGPAGAGKSSLLALLGGELMRDEGKVLWDGRKVTKLPQRVLAQEVALLSEQPFWLRKPLREVLQLPAGDLAPEARTVLADCGLVQTLERLPAGLDTKLGPGELSLRESRRVALAAVLLGEQSLLLLDHPLADLDPRAGAEVLAHLLAREDRTVLVAVPEAEAGRYPGFDRCLALDRGLLQETGRTGEVSAAEATAG